jgi:hypothetical protein
MKLRHWIDLFNIRKEIQRLVVKLRNQIIVVKNLEELSYADVSKLDVWLFDATQFGQFSFNVADLNSF